MFTERTYRGADSSTLPPYLTTQATCAWCGAYLGSVDAARKCANCHCFAHPLYAVYLRAPPRADFNKAAFELHLNELDPLNMYTPQEKRGRIEK